MMLAREADKRHSDIEAEAEQREAEVRAGVAGDNLMAALRPISVLPARRDEGRVRTIMSDADMQANPDKLFEKPSKEETEK